MKYKKGLFLRFFLISMAFFAFTTVSLAQIAGTVKDTNGEPVIGASVIQKGTTKGVVTDINGIFNINVDPGETLKFSSVGYNDVELAAENNMTVTMQEGAENIDDVVIVGYGKSSERKLASSVGIIKASALENVPVVSIAQSLAGRAPGLIVTQNGGGINANSSISIRGGGQPLVVINGVISSYNDFLLINPNDIASMSLLKDAAATAVYGVRGGEGIILVTTKQGTGKPTVRFSTELMLTEPTMLEGKLSSYEITQFRNGIDDMYNQPHFYSDTDVEKYRTGSDIYRYPNTDWQKISMKKVAPQQKYNISMQGGNDVSNYYLSIGILDQGTIFKENTNNQQRYNFRFSQTTNIKAIGLRISPAAEGYIENTIAPLSNYGPDGIDGYYGRIFSHIQDKSPMSLARNSFGQLSSETVDHPLVEMSPESGYHKRANSRIRGQLEFEWSLPWVQGLSFRATGNYSTLFTSNKSWNKTAPQFDLTGLRISEKPMSLSKTLSRNYDWTLQYFADYQRTFAKKHSIQATVGYEAYYTRGENLMGSRESYLIPVDQLNSGPASTQKNSSDEWEEGRAGWIGRLKYDYDSKYIVEGTLRYDGSDLFPKDKRWGLFYSGSAAWAISSEPFFEIIKENNILNYAKLQASYGQTGLSNIGRYAYLTSYGYNANGYILNGNIYPTFGEGALPSPDISWYKRNTLNVGLSLSSLNERLRGGVDYFYIVTQGYLASPSSTSYTDPLGISLPMVLSKGEHRREGVEFSLSWRDNIKDFNYEIGGNFTYFDQLIARTWEESETDIKNPYKRVTQQTGYYGIGYINQGYYKNSSDVMNAPRRLSSTSVVAGDIKYFDFNGDGQIDGADQPRIGKNSFPRGNYGIYANMDWKGIYLNILFQGATRRDIPISASTRGTNGQNAFIYGLQLDYWKPDNTDARFPRPQHPNNVLGNNSHNYTGSDFWLVNAAYFRLKTVEIGYDFKRVLLNKVNWLSAFKISLSGNNLLTASEATRYGYDPETASTDNYGYPVVRTYALNFSIGF